MKNKEKTMTTEKLSPSIDFYTSLENAFDFYNKELFNDELSRVFFTVRSGETKNKKTTTMGYYWEKIFAYKDSPVSEIALNITTFANRSVVDILSTLVHEMVHQWRSEVCIEPPPAKSSGGHDKIWGNKMEQLGLIPTNTGLPGGKKTGKQMTHYIHEDGVFAEKTYELIKSGFTIPVFDSYGANVNSQISLSPINIELVKSWTKNATAEEKEVLEKSLNVISDNPAIVQRDMHDLMPTPKKPTARVKKITYACPACMKKITGPEDLYVTCMECDEIFEKVVKMK